MDFDLRMLRGAHLFIHEEEADVVALERRALLERSTS
jgi:hypothetical protein